MIKAFSLFYANEPGAVIFLSSYSSREDPSARLPDSSFSKALLKSGLLPPVNVWANWGEVLCAGLSPTSLGIKSRSPESVSVVAVIKKHHKWVKLNSAEICDPLKAATIQFFHSFSEVKACCSPLRCFLSFCAEWNLSQAEFLPALGLKFNEIQLIL